MHQLTLADYSSIPSPPLHSVVILIRHVHLTLHTWLRECYCERCLNGWVWRSEAEAAIQSALITGLRRRRSKACDEGGRASRIHLQTGPTLSLTAATTDGEGNPIYWGRHGNSCYSQRQKSVVLQAKLCWDLLCRPQYQTAIGVRREGLTMIIVVNFGNWSTFVVAVKPTSASSNRRPLWVLLIFVKNDLHKREWKWK